MPTVSISRESRCASPDKDPQPLDQDAKPEKKIQRQHGPRTRATSCRNAGRLHPGIAGRHPRNPHLRHTSRVLAWVGSAMFAAFAAGAPVGAALYGGYGFTGVAL